MSEFKVGDSIVFQSLPHEKIFEVIHVGGDEIRIQERWFEENEELCAGAKRFTEEYPFSDIRHATPEEIAQGYRDE